MEIQKNHIMKISSTIVHKVLYYKLESILILLTIIGLGFKSFHLFVRLFFQSDNVFAGQSAMEFWKYQNYFFSYYYVPSDDSNIFEVIVFHLVPQILSNYDPIMLKIITFIIFLLIIIIFSFIIFFLTKSLLNALFFSALLSNWYIDYLSTILWITSHESTILMIGILLMLYFFKPVKNWDIIFLVILAGVTFSDSLILVWFTVPMIFTILITNYPKQKLREQIVSFLKFDLVFKIAFLSSIVMIYKRIFIDYYIRHPHLFQCSELMCFINTQIPLFFKSLTLLLNPDLYGIIFKTNPISYIATLFVVILIAYTILLIKNFKLQLKNDIKFFITFVGIMFVITSILYFTTAITLQLQYLKFILICLLSIFCLIDFSKSKYGKWILFIIIIINLFYVVDSPFNKPISSNEEQYHLIDFLKNSNLSFGYGEYWDSNVITYLSHEEVTIRPILIENGLDPYYWNSAKRWYNSIPENFFVIVRTTNERALYYFNNNYVLPDPVRIIDYKNYKIFDYNTSNFDVINRKYNAVKLFHSGGEKRYDPLIEEISWYADNNIEGYIIYGPYISLPRGNYRVTYMIRYDSNVSRNESVVRLEVFDNRILRQIIINNSDFLNSNTYQPFTLNFTSKNIQKLEFRVYKYYNSTIFINNISIKKV